MFRDPLIAVITLIAGTFTTTYSQSNKPIPVESWVTNPDRSALFQKQSDSVFFRNDNGGWRTPIVVDDKQQLQEIER